MCLPVGGERLAAGASQLTLIDSPTVSSWEGKTYATQAAETNYVKEYLSSTASELWSSLSDFWGEPIGKTNFRQTFESRQLVAAQRCH